jgi:hypothetical protein
VWLPRPRTVAADCHSPPSARTCTAQRAVLFVGHAKAQRHAGAYGGCPAHADKLHMRTCAEYPAVRVENGSEPFQRRLRVGQLALELAQETVPSALYPLACAQHEVTIKRMDDLYRDEFRLREHDLAAPMPVPDSYERLARVGRRAEHIPSGLPVAAGDVVAVDDIRADDGAAAAALAFETHAERIGAVRLQPPARIAPVGGRLTRARDHQRRVRCAPRLLIRKGNGLRARLARAAGDPLILQRRGRLCQHRC